MARVAPEVCSLLRPARRRKSSDSNVLSRAVNSVPTGTATICDSSRTSNPLDDRLRPLGLLALLVRFCLRLARTTNRVSRDEIDGMYSVSRHAELTPMSIDTSANPVPEPDSICHTCVVEHRHTSFLVGETAPVKIQTVFAVRHVRFCPTISVDDVLAHAAKGTDRRVIEGFNSIHGICLLKRDGNRRVETGPPVH